MTRLVDEVAELGVVAWPVDAARLDDHDRRALGDPVERDLVRQVLRLLVAGEEVLARVLVGLVDDLAVRVAEHPDRRDVDDSLDTGIDRGVEHALGPAHVRVVHRVVLRLRDPDLVDGGHVEDRVAALDALA